MAAALLSGEFQWFKVYGGWRTLARHFAAGVGMRIAVWLAVGCNVSGFYTATATLRPEVGWLYALGMYLGAKLGLRLMYKTRLTPQNDMFRCWATCFKLRPRFNTLFFVVSQSMQVAQ
jgi:hypothetical protein